MKKTTVLLDLISHENMHIPFNEGYLHVMRAAFPEDEIIFIATEGHLSNVNASLLEQLDIKTTAITNLRDELQGKSPHNPLHSIPAIKRCWRSLMEILHNKSIRLLTLSGAVGPLIHTFSKQWIKSNQVGQLHFVQHDQFARAVEWRSRNPIVRHYDYISVLNRGLPKNQKLVVLELGLEEVVLQYIPGLSGSIKTLEHPVLESEWLEEKNVPDMKEPIKVGFLGHCGVGKGFDKFVELANQFAGSNFAFYGIGKNNYIFDDETAYRNLIVAPANTHMPREEFISLLKDLDIVCLPLPQKVSTVSSGSIIDAFAALKPLVINSNQSIDAIEAKYGEFGYVADNFEGMVKFFEGFDHSQLAAHRTQWINCLRTIRQARSAESLATELQSN